MRKVNTNELPAVPWASPKGTFGGSGIQVSEALGRKPDSTDLLERHPFDVEIVRIPPGKANFPYHAHALTWEFYHVIAGSGTVRHQDGTTPVGPGDAFVFKPGEPHQIRSDETAELVLYLVADNPLSDTCYYPDSDKWSVRIPQRRIIRSEALDYYDREE